MELETKVADNHNNQLVKTELPLETKVADLCTGQYKKLRSYFGNLTIKDLDSVSDTELFECTDPRDRLWMKLFYSKMLQVAHKQAVEERKACEFYSGKQN